MNKPPQQLSPEMLVPRLGDYLVQRGDISEDSLIRALAYQQKQTATGKQFLLGDALVELKLIKREKLDQAITEQIILLRGALQSANKDLERRVQERTSELQEALRRLSELSQMKANFVSNISHELRTPLTHVKGYLELMVTESLGAISEDQRHALQVSQRSTAKLEEIIEDLIMFSLASRGELSMKLQNIDMRRLVNTVINSAANKSITRGVKLKALLAENLPMVQADPQKIGWVLNQLIDNGIKFTAPGGSVEVKIKIEAENLVMISVADTGIGIAPERLQEIFEPFHQLNGSSTRSAGGTGLGLSLVRQIIEAHGSMLEVSSTQEKGSIFKFPLVTASENK